MLWLLNEIYVDFNIVTPDLIKTNIALSAILLYFVSEQYALHSLLWRVSHEVAPQCIIHSSAIIAVLLSVRYVTRIIDNTTK
jgi:hypothetical protein